MKINPLLQNLSAVSAAAAALLLAISWFHRPVSAQPASQTADAATSQAATTTLADQSDLAITVYNSNLSLVRDVKNPAERIIRGGVLARHRHALPQQSLQR